MNPLRIPELLSLICCHLDKHSLASGTQVCRTWSHVCTPLLWEYCPFSAEYYNNYHTAFNEHAHLIRTMDAEQRLIGGEMRFIAQQCTNLSDLKLRYCHLTPASLDILCDGIPKVERLVFELCRGVNSRTAARLASLPRLQHLDVGVHAQERGSGDWREEDFVLLLTSGQHLLSLKILGPDLSHIHLLGLKRYPLPLSLVTLHLAGTFVSENALTALLEKSPCLSSLTLLHNANKNSIVQAIALNCPGLRILGLRNATSISTTAFESVFSNNPMLIQLDVSKTLIQDAALIVLAQSCPQLRVLDLSGCSRVTSAAFLKLVTLLSSLRTLRVGGCTRLKREAFSGKAPWACRGTLEVLNMACVGIRSEEEALECLAEHLCSLRRLRQLSMDTIVIQHPAVYAYLANTPHVRVSVENPPNRC
ncbi:hypothetical protein BGX28_006634 [Mortierella sp. GBA30]|nr:hypothetical protein BGX28_006634 [Mortierella sp. GBA30]